MRVLLLLANALVCAVNVFFFVALGNPFNAACAVVSALMFGLVAVTR